MSQPIGAKEDAGLRIPSQAFSQVMNISTHDSTDSQYPPWPYSPAEDMPQLITFLIVSADNRVADVWWSEVMELVGMGLSTFVTQSQLERIADWLKLWMATEPRGFTEDGTMAVEDMLAKVRRSLAFHEQHGQWQRQCVTDEWDHLL
jgi:hypothetical protein